MIASLPMYDTAATRAANDRLWTEIRHRLGRGPDALDRNGDPHDQWHNPNLLLSQTCSLPFRTELIGKVQLVGTPDYSLEDCPSGYYRSCIVVRRDDPRRNLSEFAGARLARNDIRSQSGWAAIEEHLTEQGLPFSFAGNVIETGAHSASAHAVASGRADVAALDAVTWALLQRDTMVQDNLRVLAVTKPSPGLPLITSLGENAKELFHAVKDAIASLSQKDREMLMLKDLVFIPEEKYTLGYTFPS